MKNNKLTVRKAAGERWVSYLILLVLLMLPFLMAFPIDGRFVQRLLVAYVGFAPIWLPCEILCVYEYYWRVEIQGGRIIHHGFFRKPRIYSIQDIKRIEIKPYRVSEKGATVRIFFTDGKTLKLHNSNAGYDEAEMYFRRLIYQKETKR